MGGYLTSIDQLALGKVYHIGATHSNNTSKLYFNTKLQNTQQVTPVNYMNSNLSIGRYITSSYLNGEILAIRMYNRELTQEEMDKNYQIDKMRFDL